MPPLNRSEEAKPKDTSHLPHRSAVVTAGLKCAPETLPRANIMHMRDAAIENTAALELARRFKPTVRTSMYVPKNSLYNLLLSGKGWSARVSSKPLGRHARRRMEARAAPRISETK